jgi:hypothetical protein
MMGLRPAEMIFLLTILCFLVLYVYALWRLVSKTGNPGPLALLFLVPLVNIGMFLFFAFSEWPIERELRALREQSNR